MNAQAETQSATMPRIDSVDLIRPFPLITSRLDRMRNEETPDRSGVPGRNGRSAYAGTIDRLFVNRRGSARGEDSPRQSAARGSCCQADFRPTKRKIGRGAASC